MMSDTTFEKIKEKKLPKKIMNEEIKKHKVYVLNIFGKLVPAIWIKSTEDYSHKEYNLHHFIEFQHYSRNEEWYKERGIAQKLILMRVKTHEQLHHLAIRNLTDEEFEKSYKISRWKLVFNRKYSEY